MGPDWRPEVVQSSFPSSALMLLEVISFCNAPRMWHSQQEGAVGSRELLPTFSCCYCTRWDGLGFWAPKSAFVPQRQEIPSFMYWFSFFKSTTFLFHTPGSGDASSLGAGRLHLILLTCLGPVSLKQKLSQWERYSTSSLKSIIPSAPLLPWLSRLVLYRKLFGRVSF